MRVLRAGSKCLIVYRPLPHQIANAWIPRGYWKRFCWPEFALILCINGWKKEPTKEMPDFPRVEENKGDGIH
jgi:hypothetical protein